MTFRRLVKNPSIRVLNLRSNQVSELGAAFIQFVLVANPNLMSLGLADNELGNSGVRCLGSGASAFLLWLTVTQRCREWMRLRSC